LNISETTPDRAIVTVEGHSIFISNISNTVRFTDSFYYSNNKLLLSNIIL